MAHQASLPWYRYLGPWPLRPLISFFALLAWFSAVGTGAQLTDSSQQTGVPAVAEVLALSLTVALAGTAVIVAGQQWQRRRGLHTLAYVVTLLVAAVVMTVVRFVTFPFERVVLATEPALILVGARALIVLLLVHGISGAVTWRLTEKNRQIQQALDTAQRQQVDLVRADEEVRQQMASLLHDQVQSSLIAVCLRLQSLSGRVPAEERSLLVDAVDRLEQVRALDVRNAVRRLSPSLDEVDLQSALEELATTYEPSVTVDICVDARVDNAGIDSQVRLAAYRIVEQALMNAVVHGGSSRIRVEVAIDGDSVRVSVVDDGTGLPTTAVSEGMGLLLISTWTRALGGHWTLDSPGQGARLVAELPSQM